MSATSTVQGIARSEPLKRLAGLGFTVSRRTVSILQTRTVGSIALGRYGYAEALWPRT